ncbi:undecaprenyl diphosphate synthase family protein [Halorientalis pallida]|uniref:undecaprenyl diphosphate synthase family protein n=1 Tax=Halorientalis pallida TaxID=2479928 RepID=UPI003C6F067C
MGIYDQYLAVRTQWADEETPDNVAVVITERDLLEQGAYDTLESFFDWAVEYGAERVMVYVSVLDEKAVPTLRRALEDVDAPREMAVRGPDDDRRADAPIQVSIGLGGKHEFAAAVRSVAEEVDDGELTPGEIDEDDIEQRLVFPTDPDLVIKTGAERLSDFMIWQSVYSELYFTDVNWRDFRKREYLRAIRDFQDRQRRFGQ